MTSPSSAIHAGLLDQARQRMERRWRDIAIAEERGMPQYVLDRMLDAYQHALDAYLALQQGGDDAAPSIHP